MIPKCGCAAPIAPLLANPCSCQSQAVIPAQVPLVPTPIVLNPVPIVPTPAPLPCPLPEPAPLPCPPPAPVACVPPPPPAPVPIVPAPQKVFVTAPIPLSLPFSLNDFGKLPSFPCEKCTVCAKIPSFFANIIKKWKCKFDCYSAKCNPNEVIVL